MCEPCRYMGVRANLQMLMQLSVADYRALFREYAIALLQMGRQVRALQSLV